MTRLPPFFNNLRVVEFASVLAGPAVGQFFAELGAEVIKIERPDGGDVTRSWKLAGEDHRSSSSAYFSAVNWGKRSITLDLNDPSDLKRAKLLSEKADVVISNFLPRQANRYGLTYAHLADNNPRLIFAEISAYGEGSERPGYDSLLQAESGFMAINGYKDGGPLKMPVALIDLLAAHELKQGCLLGLLQRARTHKGLKVSISLLESALIALANQASNYLVAHTNPERIGSEHPNIAPYGSIFLTKDLREIVLAVGTDTQFQKLLLALGLEDQRANPLFVTNQERVKNRTALNNLLQESIAMQECDTLLGKLDQLSVPGTEVASVAKALQSPRAANILRTAQVADGTFIRGLRSFSIRSEGISFAEELTPPPQLGEHNHQLEQFLTP